MLGKKALAALAPLLEDPDDPRPNASGELYIYCPYHGDHDRSASLNFESTLWHCKVCGEAGPISDVIKDRDNWVIEENRTRRSSGSGAKPTRHFEMTEMEVAGWTDALLTSQPLLEVLMTRRGLTLDTILKREIGWDHPYKAYTIPVRDVYGEIINYRFYRFDPPEGRRKIWSVAGHGTPPQLYPIDQMDHDTLVICEGEWDAMLTAQMGIPAITRTSAADAWVMGWCKLFYGKDLILCHDMDAKGQHANAKLADLLRPFARTVAVVQLPYPVDPKHGKDLTDYWLDGHTVEDFLGLVPEHEPPEESPTADSIAISVGILDTLDNPDLAGQTLKMPVTISGRHMDNWLIPTEYTLTCDMSQKAKCNNCQLAAWSGEHKGEIQRNDPLILGLVGTTSNALVTAILQRDGVYDKCPAVDFDRLSEMRVEQLFVRPSLEANTESERQDFTQRRIISSANVLGLTDNMIVDLFGSTVPHPLTQRNEFLAWEVNKPPNMLDDWDLSEATVKRISKFQDDGDPFKKCMDIARDTINTVTGIRDRELMHVFMDLVFHSALEIHPFGEKDASKGTLDALILGDTRTGKSEAAGKMLADYAVGDMVNCESASLAGLLGGLEKVGDGGFVVKWGSLPVNDRRIVVMDEVSGLTLDQISQLTDIRTRGEARIDKIKTAKAHARTRMLWLGNYRKGSNPANAMEGMRQLIGQSEDIARFEMVMGVFTDEVSIDIINPTEIAEAQARRKYGQRARRECLRWAWTRHTHQIIIDKETAEYNNAQAKEVAGRYTPDPPLVMGSNVRLKLIRIATAFALRTFSCDDTYQNCIVLPKHIDAAVRLLDTVYTNPRFGYGNISTIRSANDAKVEENLDSIMQKITSYPNLLDFLAKEDKFNSFIMCTLLNMDQASAADIISMLYDMGLIYMLEGFVMVHDKFRQSIQQYRRI